MEERESGGSGNGKENFSILFFGFAWVIGCGFRLLAFRPARFARFFFF
jgi:hypothetical protein